MSPRGFAAIGTVCVTLAVLVAGVPIAGAASSGRFAANESWTTNPYFGNNGTFFADVTGDRRADAIAVVQDTEENTGSARKMVVRRSTGSQFSANENWGRGFSKGTHLFADVNADGLSDAIEGNPITVCRSTRVVFAGCKNWTENPFSGSKGRFFADVTGDRRADAIVVNGDKITVRRSTSLGSVFTGNESWTTDPFFGSEGTFVADVTGDGKADAIAVNSSKVTVRRSTGTAFSAKESWTSNPFFGSKGTFFADVDGDRKADAIAVNKDKVTVRRSRGFKFAGNESWTTNPYFGSKGTFFVDVTGDRRADAIVVNDDKVTVRRSAGP